MSSARLDDAAPQSDAGVLRLPAAPVEQLAHAAAQAVRADQPVSGDANALACVAPLENSEESAALACLLVTKEVEKREIGFHGSLSELLRQEVDQHVAPDADSLAVRLVRLDRLALLAALDNRLDDGALLSYCVGQARINRAQRRHSAWPYRLRCAHVAPASERKVE